ncbi:hypothetical protein HAX54_045524 [Datura stramonium]|uniref:Uncharacterized protein n=1 Tax=Datura stramonium TaxID=4076 RepID=A0ABS8WHZ1_DATST|nr:hypothetical protein [Datura stramonium]
MANPVAQINLPPKEMMKNIDNGVRESRPCQRIECHTTQALAGQKLASHTDLGTAQSVATHTNVGPGSATSCRLVLKGEVRGSTGTPIMAPKPSKGKGVASSSHGSKRSKRASEEQNEDEPLDDDDTTDEEQARIDSDLESDDDKDDSEIGGSCFCFHRR